MSTTVNMSLGMLFVVLAIAAVLLQARLWGPQFWDHVGKKTRASKAWLAEKPMVIASRPKVAAAPERTP